jgi:hypothetical protein
VGKVGDFRGLEMRIGAATRGCTKKELEGSAQLVCADHSDLHK